MKRLLTFESFVPKNIEKRNKDLEVIEAKKLKEYEAFIKEFENYLSLIKDKTSDDPQEQLFIDIIKDCQIKLDQEKYPFRILLLHNDILLFEYLWKDDFIWCQYDKVWSVFESKFKIQYKNFQDFINFIKNMLEKLFKFKLF